MRKSMTIAAAASVAVLFTGCGPEEPDLEPQPTTTAAQDSADAGIDVGTDDEMTSHADRIGEAVETVTETVTVDAPAKSVEVEVVPQVCLDALDDGEVIIGLGAESLQLSAEGFGYAADGMGALIDGDIGGLNAATDGMTEVSAEMDDVTVETEVAVDEYLTSATECRAIADE